MDPHTLRVSWLGSECCIPSLTLRIILDFMAPAVCMVAALVAFTHWLLDHLVTKLLSHCHGGCHACMALLWQQCDWHLHVAYTRHHEAHLCCKFHTCGKPTICTPTAPAASRLTRFWVISCHANMCSAAYFLHTHLVLSCPITLGLQARNPTTG